MDDTVYYLANSIIRFLDTQMKQPTISSTAKDKINVAVMCLKEAYGIQQTFLYEQPLLKIYEDFIKMQHVLRNNENGFIPLYLPYSPASTPEEVLELTTRQSVSSSSRSSSCSSEPSNLQVDYPQQPLDLSCVGPKHELKRLAPKGGCMQCGKEGRFTKRGRPHESYYGCLVCRVHLCKKRECFKAWHNLK